LSWWAELALFSFTPPTRPAVRNSSEIAWNQLDKPYNNCNWSNGRQPQTILNGRRTKTHLN
jgi:hypothetical protein